MQPSEPKRIRIVLSRGGSWKLVGWKLEVGSLSKTMAVTLSPVDRCPKKVCGKDQGPGAGRTRSVQPAEPSTWSLALSLLAEATKKRSR